jgi:hypothetical protein
MGQVPVVSQPKSKPAILTPAYSVWPVGEVEAGAGEDVGEGSVGVEAVPADDPELGSMEAIDVVRPGVEVEEMS